MIKKNNKLHSIVITTGDPAGIGPDITIMAIQKKWPFNLVICADPDLLLERAKKINLPLKLKSYDQKKISTCDPGEASILEISLLHPVILGQPNINNNHYIINTLNRATQGCINGEFSALVTGPINKAILNKDNIPFSGHTEFLAKISKSTKTIMMLSNKILRIALVTTHIPISSVSKFITPQSLSETIIILNQGLQKYFNILYPKIYVCGLNPHAGESGYIGQEEVDTIIPTLNYFKKNKNYNIVGPLSADTIFQSKYLLDADVILTMYHDQGLPVLKYIGFNKSVNITFGLPFIRTSVDHGTALELSGTGLSKPNSMIMAIITAIKMANNFYAKKIL